MEENTVFVKLYSGDEPALAVNSDELRRYSGYLSLADDMNESLRELYSSVVDDILPIAEYKVCYRRMRLERREGRIVMPFGEGSRDAERLLCHSDEIIVFAATVGLGIDRYIARNQHISPAKALVAQGFGAERIETLCNAFCAEMRASLSAEGLGMTPRFSPGYGDMALAAQTDIFRLLDCSRRIGLSLNSSLLMMPSKSVTAFFGTTPDETADVPGNKCRRCTKTDCQYRK